MRDDRWAPYGAAAGWIVVGSVVLALRASRASDPGELIGPTRA